MLYLSCEKNENKQIEAGFGPLEKKIQTSKTGGQRYSSDPSPYKVSELSIHRHSEEFSKLQCDLFFCYSILRYLIIGRCV